MYYGIPSFGIPDYGLPIFGIPSISSQVDDSSNDNDFIMNFVFTILGDEDAITPDLYKYVSDKYGLVYKNVQDSYVLFNQAVVHIAQIDNVEAKLDLLKPLRQSYREFSQNSFISQLYAATIKINTHVLDRSDSGNLNTWLSDNEVKVVREWADLCAETGTIIEETNIQS